MLAVATGPGLRLHPLTMETTAARTSPPIATRRPRPELTAIASTLNPPLAGMKDATARRGDDVGRAEVRHRRRRFDRVGASGAGVVRPVEFRLGDDPVTDGAVE